MSERVHWQEKFEAIGTHWTIDIFDPLSDLSQEELFGLLQERINEFDKIYSRFRSDSVVTRMSQQSGEYVLPEDSVKLIGLYHQLYKLTDGKLTPLIGQTLEQAGYDSQYSFKPQTLTDLPEWNEVMRYESSTYTLTLLRPALLDFGAAGKGYLVDIISELLEKQGITQYIVDAGSDIRHRDVQALDIALENPSNATKAIGVVKLINQSLCASAGNRRKWEGFHHIINPHTLKSPTDILATWVIADTTFVADGLATALFLALPENLTSHFNFQYLILYSDFSIKKSNEFPAELFTA